MEGLDGASARRGLSDVIATVLILAIIIVTFAVTSGLWFGTGGSLANPANVVPVRVDEAVVSSAITNGAAYVYCSNDTSATASAYIHLSNRGTTSVGAKVLDLAYGGATAWIAISGACSIPPESSVNLVILSLPYQATPAENYTGYVSLTSGAQVRFAGTFA